MNESSIFQKSVEYFRFEFKTFVFYNAPEASWQPSLEAYYTKQYNTNNTRGAVQKSRRHTQ